MLEQLEAIFARYKEVELLLSSPEIASDVKKFSKLNKEYSDLKELVEYYHKYKNLTENIAEAKSIIQDGSDKEMVELAKEELEELEDERPAMEEHIKMLLIPKDPNDDKSAIVEIRAGTGGDEASLFAGDLYRMYQKFSTDKGWKHEIMSVVDGTAGGYSKIFFSLEGPGVFGLMKFESGVHRVQRVPNTESQGRVHTSAATVAVMPEVDEVDFELNLNDVKRDTFRASGAGGQHVNKTESAIRLTHIPSGIVAECQDGRSQLKNYEKALKVLRSRLYEQEEAKRHAERAAERKSLVSTGDRSAKIRTYNFPQGRVTDHRINLTLYNLNQVLNGDLNEVIQKLQIADNAAKMKEGQE